MGRRARFAVILSLVALASFAIALDRLTQPQTSQVDFHEAPGWSTTSTASPTPGR